METSFVNHHCWAREIEKMPICGQEQHMNKIFINLINCVISFKEMKIHKSYYMQFSSQIRDGFNPKSNPYTSDWQYGPKTTTCLTSKYLYINPNKNGNNECRDLARNQDLNCRKNEIVQMPGTRNPSKPHSVSNPYISNKKCVSSTTDCNNGKYIKINSLQFTYMAQHENHGKQYHIYALCLVWKDLQRKTVFNSNPENWFF